MSPVWVQVLGGLVGLALGGLLSAIWYLVADWWTWHHG